jgi:glycosyltransferase involved in cell wall biosynthesis
MNSVAYVTTTFPTLAAFIESEVHRLRARGVQVRVFTLGPVGRECQPEHQSLVPLTESIGSPFRLDGWLALLGWLVRRPHVLVPETIRMLWASRGSGYALAGHLGYLPAAARVANRIERESLERVHGAWAHFPASVAYLAARLTGVPFSMAAHAGADLYRTRAFLREKARAATFVVGCVRGNVEMLRELAGRDARIEWLYHGVDLTRFDGHGRSRAPETRLLAVGRLAPTKGFDDAVRTLAGLVRRGVDARLTLVGDGPERESLEALASSLGVSDRLELPGALTHEQLLPHYRRAWLLLAPCKVLGGRRDGIPNVVVEAMAMGVPCAGTQAAGLEEIIAHGETGTLTAPNDPEAMAEVLAPLLREPSTIDAMGRNARARVARDFDQAANFERLASLFDGPIARTRRERADQPAAESVAS